MHRLFDGHEHSELYAQFRPTYPQAVVDTVLDFAKKTNQQPPFDQILDVGCGNGQATRLFAPHTKKITAIDVSENQIKQAKAANKDSHVEYLIGKGEELPVDDSSVDIIISGQAIHWVDHDKFFAECERVLKPTGFVVLFGYDYPRLNKVGAVTDEIKRVKCFEIGNNRFKEVRSRLPWSPRIKLIDDNYEAIYKLILSGSKQRNDDIKIHKTMSLDHLYSYLCTWSGYQTHMENAKTELMALRGNVNDEELRKYDVIADFIDELKSIWNVKEDDNAVEVEVEWDVFMLFSYRPFK